MPVVLTETTRNQLKVALPTPKHPGRQTAAGRSQDITLSMQKMMVKRLYLSDKWRTHPWASQFGF
jgi:hypothetical protein